MAVQAVSAASAQLSPIGHELSVLANLVNVQNRIPVFELLLGNRHLASNDTHSAMIREGEIASYNDLASIVVASQELESRNIQGANEGLNVATKAISAVSKILL